MRHLDPEALIDFAEGERQETATRHLAECVCCRVQLEEMIAAMAAVRDVEVPEPSPLFWDHVSARVRERVASEGRPEASRPMAGLSRWVWWAGLTAAACAAALLIVVLPATTSRQPEVLATDQAATAQAPLAGEPAIALNTATEPGSMGDDEALSLITDLAGDIDWDDAAAEGLTAPAVAIDRAITELTADERAEMHRLLTQELTRTGA